MSVEIQDHSAEVSAEIKAALLRGLEKIGLVAEGYAKKLCAVDTGNLRNSITHMIDEQEPAAIIGTNNEYAAYVELGTGIYAEGGGGRPTPWVYQDAKGNWHMTHGNKPQPFFETSCRRPCRTVSGHSGKRAEKWITKLSRPLKPSSSAATMLKYAEKATGTSF